MGSLSYNEVTVTTQGAEHLHINMHNRNVSAKISAFRFIDKDTRQYIIYMPSLELSAYGETIEKAKEMLHTALEDCFEYLLSLSLNELEAELHQYGWKKGALNKDFSRPFADGNMELQNFNAETDSIERVMLTAA